MEKEILEEIVRGYIITKEDLKNYFNNKKVIDKEKYLEYVKNKKLSC